MPELYQRCGACVCIHAPLLAQFLLFVKSPKRERQRVIAFYSFAANRESKYNYQAYRLEGVKKALEGLFHGKCAYCESRYTATQPVDVEHYRPKGEVICSNGQCLNNTCANYAGTGSAGAA